MRPDWLGVEHGGRADVWLGMQAAYDLWAEEKKAKTVIRKVKPLSAAALAFVAKAASESLRER